MRSQRPPARHLFDEVSLHAALPKLHGWEADARPSSTAGGRLPPPALAERGVDHGDVDAPCWVFTPGVVPGCCRASVADRLLPFRHRTLSADEAGRLRVPCGTSHVGRCGGDSGIVPQSPGSPQELAGRAGPPRDVAGQGPRRCCRNCSAGICLEELEQQKKQLKDEQRRLDNEVRHLQGLMEEFTTSTSWRLTRPLHWLGRVLKSTELARKLLYDPFRRKG